MPPICSLSISLIKSGRRYAFLRELTFPARCFPLQTAFPLLLQTRFRALPLWICLSVLWGLSLSGFDFKEKGKDALASAVKGMHLTQGLQKLQSSLHTVMLSMDQKIDRLGSMAEELHAAKGHLKNAFLEMNGKDTAKITDRNPEQGIIFQTQKVLFQSMRNIHKLEQKTERLQRQIGKLEERQGKQASLKDTLQELRQETAPRQLGKEEKQKAAIR